MIRNVLRLVLAVNFCLKSFESSGENSYLCCREQ